MAASEIDFLRLLYRQISYSYRVFHIPFSDYRGKQELPIPKLDGTVTERIVKKRYAVRIEFSQTGKIGGSFLLFYINIVKGLLIQSSHSQNHYEAFRWTLSFIFLR